MTQAVALAAPTFAETVDRLTSQRTPDLARLHRASISLARYLVRMRRRATPFGLFAGVAPLAISGPAHQARAEGQRARLRANGDWLDTIITELESTPGALPGLRVVANDVMTVRGTRLHIGWRPHGHAQRGDRPTAASLRHTRPVAFALAQAAHPTPVSDLLAKLKAEFPAARGEAQEALVKQLIEVGALISDLRAPSVHVDALGYLLNVLNRMRTADAPRRRRIVEELGAIHTAIESDEQAPAGAEDRRVLIERMRVLADTPQPLAVDLKIADVPAIPAAVGGAAAEAAAALLRLSPAAYGKPSWHEYHARFLDRYGAGAFVPVRHLVDEAAGLGFPRHFTDTASRRPTAVTPRGLWLLALAQQSALDGAIEVALTDADLDAFTGGNGVRWPAHLDITVDVRAVSKAALESGDFAVSVMGVGRSALATSGRFLDLFPGHEREVLAALPTAVDGAVPAQVSFSPHRPSMQTVARVAQLLPMVLTVGEHHRDGPDVLRPDDLAVLADLDRFYVASLSRRQIVEPVITCAAAPHTMPPLMRLLLELPHATSTPISQFSWGVAGSLPFLPRLRYGRVVLSPARWQLPAGELPDRTAPGPEWSYAFEALRNRLHLPSFVSVGAGDQQLRLNLDDPMNLALLRAHLNQTVGTVQVTEAPADGDYGWCGGRTHEIVVPLVTTAAPARPPAAATRATWGPLIGHDHADLPGGSLLFAKLYGPPDAIDAIITEQLPQLWAQWETPPEWWFVRYRDPYPHLRLRLPTTSYGRDATRLSRWAARLRDLRLAGDLTLDTYRPETARYGDGPAMAAAEMLFAADSAAAAAQVAAADGHASEADALAAASLVDLLAGLLDGTEPAMRWLLENPELHPRVANPDRAVPRRAFDLAPVNGDDAGPADARGLSPQSAAAWRQRARVAHRYARCLREDACGPTPEVAAVSLLHLHHNRVLGRDPEREARVYHVARSVALTHAARRAQGRPS
ncbi:lantibiotic dehydratase [Actinoplanes sp. RD1]|uniref:lantibiotic dehydratase n=1 Tax=Actinoplanes sp. RD1 TaxID=3064538 RepID=UPI002741B967|nr:lantibiotic dehydratase [Actinoplanes sp. RD1]